MKIFKFLTQIIVLLFVVNVYISFAEKMLTVTWDIESVRDLAGFKIYNNGTDLIVDVNDPTARSYTGAITIILGGVNTTILSEGENIITVRSYDLAGNVSADSLPAESIIIDTIAPPVPINVMANISDI